MQELKNNPCTDCGGIFHPQAMHWDHLTDKRKDVATMVHHGYSKAAITKELLKCELVCANCHAVRTVTRREAL